MTTGTGKPWIDDAYTIWVCQCCMLIHANGECCTERAPMHSDGSFCFEGAANCYRSHGTTVMLSIGDEYASKFGRQTLTLWSGAFMSTPEGTATELPKHNGFMVDKTYGPTIRVECESPRTDENCRRVDDAINAALGEAILATAPLLHGGDGREPLSSLSPNDGLAMGMGSEEHTEGCLPDNYEYDGETNTFSTSSCDGCGSQLAGERHAMTVFPGERAPREDSKP